MINAFILKKWVALVFAQLFTIICFFIGLRYYGFWISLATAGGGMLVGTLMAIMLLKNPFTQMIEGKGILVGNLDSTGIFRFFIVAVRSPYIYGRLGKKVVNDVFDRSTVYSLATPKKAKKVAELKEDGGIKIDITGEELNKARFGLFHYPFLLWNDQINGLLTKDFLSEQEKQTFAEHTVLYLNRKMEELTSSVRDFGRHVVELTKPQGGGFFAQHKWAIIIVMIFVGILALIFAPHIINAVKGGFEGGGALSNIVNTGKTVVQQP